jgi:hypothetical protein
MTRDVNLNFKKRWIPFVLEFAQANLKKMDERYLASYRKDFLFLSSPLAEKFNDYEFKERWENGLNQDVDLDLAGLQSELKKVLKFWRRKNDTRTRSRILYYVKTLSCLYIERDLQKNDHFTMRQHLLYDKGQDESLKRIQDVIFFFMKLLVGLPLSAIRTCHGCRRYFLQISEREKIYCNSACASRSIQREKREDLWKNHPRKYKAFLKKQREIMGHRRALTKKTL